MKELLEGISATLPEADVTLINERLTKLKKEWMEAAQNDSDFISNLTREAQSKAYFTTERWIKKMAGVDFEKLPADLKAGERVKSGLEMAFEAVRSSKDHTNQELQDQLLKVKDELRKVREEEVPEIEGRYKAKFDEKNIESAISSKIPELNVIPDRAKAAQTYLKAVLNDRYQAKWEDGLTILTKDSLKPVINDKPAGVDDVLRSILDEAGFIQKSNGTDTKREPGQTTRTTAKPERASRIKELAATYPGAQ